MKKCILKGIAGFSIILASGGMTLQGCRGNVTSEQESVPVTTEATSESPEIVIDEVNFPGEYLRNWASGKAVDTNQNGMLSEAEINRVKKFQVFEENENVIELDLKGIEYFNKLYSIDIRECNIINKKYLNNLGIKYICIYECSMENLNFNKMEELEDLDLYKVNGTKIKLVNPKLRNLGLSEMKLTTVNVKKCANINYIHMINCKTKKLKIGKKEKLERLWIENCKLENANYKHLPNLKVLCVMNNKVKKINPSLYKELDALICTNNKIETIDVSKNEKLTSLSVGGTKLKELDVSKNKKLDSLYLKNTKISKLDLSNNKKISFVEFTNTKIKELDLRKGTNDIPIRVICGDNVKVLEPRGGIERMNAKEWKNYD